MTEKLSDQTIRTILENMAQDIKDIKDTHGKDLAEIKAQTQKTNGRVTKLEIWQGYIKGGLALLGLGAIPIISKFWK